jgi:hypothetical protein
VYGMSAARTSIRKVKKVLLIGNVFYCWLYRSFYLYYFLVTVQVLFYLSLIRRFRVYKDERSDGVGRDF